VLSSGGTVRDELDQEGIVITACARAEFESLAAGLGRLVPAKRGGPVIDQLVPRRREDAPMRSLSGAHGYDEFPFHTDAAHHRLPPRFVALRLQDDAESETPTLLVDSRVVPLSEEELATLKREPWLVKGGPYRTFYASILGPTPSGSRLLLRFDPVCMEAISGTVPRGGRVIEAAVRAAAQIQVKWIRDRVVIWDNWRFLHARPAIDTRDIGRRAIERALVESEEPHPR
jgi:L-asparagine oxygenase